MGHIVCALFGLIIGSFLTACIYRIPLGRKSGLDDEEEESSQDEKDIVQANSPFFEKKVTLRYPPRSFCPSCGKQLRWYHNIPFFSWLLLGGKCAFCKTKISARYPAVELLSAFFALLSFSHFGMTWTAALIYIFVCMLIVISFIDIDYYIIPNVISYPATLIGVLLAALNQFTGIFLAPIVSDVLSSILGILAGAGFLWLISEIYFRIRKREGLGLGDVKLLAVTGAFFGAEAAWYTIFVGSLLGTVFGLLSLVIFGRKFSHYLPFGPYLAVANVLFIFLGTNKTFEFFGLYPPGFTGI